MKRSMKCLFGLAMFFVLIMASVGYANAGKKQTEIQCIGYGKGALNATFEPPAEGYLYIYLSCNETGSINFELEQQGIGGKVTKNFKSTEMKFVEENGIRYAECEYVHAIKKGKFKITIMYNGGGGGYRILWVNHKEKPKYYGNGCHVSIGCKAELNVFQYNNKPYKGNVDFKVADSRIVKKDKKGILKGAAKGNTTVTAILEDGTKILGLDVIVTGANKYESTMVPETSGTGMRICSMKYNKNGGLDIKYRLYNGNTSEKLTKFVACLDIMKVVGYASNGDPKTKNLIKNYKLAQKCAIKAGGYKDFTHTIPADKVGQGIDLSNSHLGAHIKYEINFGSVSHTTEEFSSLV